jgi:hypothetical protein
MGTYLSRSRSLLEFLLVIMIFFGWAAGGYLLAASSRRFHRREYLIAGLAGGFLIYITLSNLLAHFFHPPLAFYLASAGTLAFGAASAWRQINNRRSIIKLIDVHQWPQLLALLLIFLVFASIQRGLGIFDDYNNLPLVSTMAVGDIPPHFYLNPQMTYGYHYGLHLFAASLVSVVGLYPWRAWDYTLAFTAAIALMTSWIWLRRITRNSFGAGLGAMLLCFGSGTRWLLTFLPPSWLKEASAHIHMLGSSVSVGPNLAADLRLPWLIGGGPPVPFPFAYANGIVVPTSLAWGGSGAIPLLGTALLLLLAGRRRWEKTTMIFAVLILSAVSLCAEHVFALLALGFAIELGGRVLLFRKGIKPLLPATLLQLTGIFIVSGLLSLVQGGVFTEALGFFVPGGTSQGVYFNPLFNLRWPPGIISAHLGMLPFTDPWALIVALAEIGPVLFLAPLAVFLAIRWFLKGHWIEAGIAWASLIGFLFSLFIQFNQERELARLSGFSSMVWFLIGWPSLLAWFKTGKAAAKTLLPVGYGLVILGGVVFFAIQLTSISQPIVAEFGDELDARMTGIYWNRLKPEDRVFDVVPYRAVTIFGREVTTNSHLFETLPEWRGLVNDPDPVKIAKSGFPYLYVRKEWWTGLTREQRRKLTQPCVRLVNELTDDITLDWARLYDLSSCK